MSDGNDWLAHIHDVEKAKTIKAHLQDPVSADAWLQLKDLDISIETLQLVTNLEQPPTAAWYALHSSVRHTRKWQQWTVAWGLNISRPDLYIMQRYMIALIMEHRHEANKRCEDVDTSMLLRDMTSLMQREYSNMARRFRTAIVPIYWYVDAQNMFIERCISDSEKMLDRGFYDRDTSQLTTFGEQMWAELHQNSMSTNEFLQSTFAVLKDDEKTTSPQTCAPCIKCMPQEILDQIVGHALDVPDLFGSKLPKWILANKKILCSSAGWYSRNKAVVIRARSWPKEGFPPGTLPVRWLQQIETAYFDFDGVTYSDLRKPQPVIRQLADIWIKENRLKSLILPIAPSYDSLSAEEPRLEFDEGMGPPLAPLSEIKSIKPEYVYDFGAPIVASGMNALCLAARGWGQSPRTLPFVLERSKEHINVKTPNYFTVPVTPLHHALMAKSHDQFELLLEVKNVDVNSKDGRGNTPIEVACSKRLEREAFLLGKHEQVRVTLESYNSAVRNHMSSELISGLGRRRQGLPFY
jgi:hypothetical protein